MKHNWRFHSRHSQLRSNTVLSANLLQHQRKHVLHESLKTILRLPPTSAIGVRQCLESKPSPAYNRRTCVGCRHLCCMNISDDQTRLFPFVDIHSCVQALSGAPTLPAYPQASAISLKTKTRLPPFVYVRSCVQIMTGALNIPVQPQASAIAGKQLYNV